MEKRLYQHRRIITPGSISSVLAQHDFKVSRYDYKNFNSTYLSDNNRCFSDTISNASGYLDVVPHINYPIGGIWNWSGVLMNTIELKSDGTRIARAVVVDAFVRNIFVRISIIAFWIVSCFASVGILANYAGIYILTDFLLGLGFILFGLFLFYLSVRAYYFQALKGPGKESLREILGESPQSKNLNLYAYFSFDLAKNIGHLISKETVLPKDVLLSLSKAETLIFVSYRLGLRIDDLASYITNSTPVNIKDLSQRALEVAIDLSHSEITTGDFLLALLQIDPELSKALKGLKIGAEDVKNILYWQTNINKRIERDKGFFNPAKLKLTGGIGKDWAYGWTPFLKQFSVDLSKSVQQSGLGLEVIGHDSEIEQIKEALLRQSGGNVILVGEPGVGKSTTVLGFVKKVVEGQTNTDLDFKHIVRIDTNYLLSGVTAGGDVTNRISGLISEAMAAGNIILYFENFQNLVSSGDAGRVDASEVLLPFLDQPGVHLLATCDTGSYNKFIATNSALNERLTRVTVGEPDKTEMIRILEDVVPMIEYKTKSVVSYEAIKQTIDAADKYIMNLPNPEKSISLIDGVTAKATSERGKTIILPKDVDSYVAEKYEIPVGDVENDEKNKLLNLESEMHRSVIGQEEAIVAIADALRRVRAGIVDSKKPIGSFLFLGPTGVGKTETAKALARSYFGDESKMIRFDMSEYQNKADIYRLIGSNLSGEDEIGLLTTAVREHPFSLILFDEVEKAHSDILDLFLQMLDEGFITDGVGRKVSFTNSIIILTSNAGANLIRESIKSGEEYSKLKKALVDYLQKENIFRPEFINRFSAVIAFSPLSLVEIKEVAGLMIQKMVDIIAKNKSINVNVDGTAIDKLASLGFDPQMGARPMARVIQEKLESFLAKKILSGELKNGDTTTITEGDIG